MKPSYHITLAQVRPTLAEILQWPERLRLLHQQLHPFFARSEPRHLSLLYLQALLSDVPRKNGWQIAEQACQARPYGMQRLLSHADWDEQGVRDVLRTLVCRTLQLPASSSSSAHHDPLFPILVVDESAFPKRGHHSAGVAVQYCGRTGRLENCQVGVFLAYVTAAGHGLIDRDLYLPEVWCQDEARRHDAHIPPNLRFQTKPELSVQMLERALQAGLRPRWVVADTVYGHSTDLRLSLEKQNLPYAVAVPCIEVVCACTPSGLRRDTVAALTAQLLTPQDWQRLSVSLGTKGERFFDWARLPLLHHGTLDHQYWLVVRRCLDEPQELAYYLVWAPLHTPLSLMAQAIGARWHIEEDLQEAKKIGLAQYEVRSFLGWYRHLTLVLLASAFLLTLCVPQPAAPTATLAGSPPAVPEVPVPLLTPLAPLPALSDPDPAAPEVPLIPLTRSEVRHLLAHLVWPAPTSALLICEWSWWRRRHQYWAGYYHRRRRQKSA